MHHYVYGFAGSSNGARSFDSLSSNFRYLITISAARSSQCDSRSVPAMLVIVYLSFSTGLLLVMRIYAPNRYGSMAQWMSEAAAYDGGFRTILNDWMTFGAGTQL